MSLATVTSGWSSHFIFRFADYSAIGGGSPAATNGPTIGAANRRYFPSGRSLDWNFTADNKTKAVAPTAAQSVEYMSHGGAMEALATAAAIVPASTATIVEGRGFIGGSGETVSEATL